MTPEKISIAPSPEMIIAEIAREGMTWEKALGEPIDNSLDAGATRILIEINKKAKRVRIEDNGSGCPEPHRMLVSGYTTKKRGGRTLGRYGVGLKHSSWYFCGKDGATRIVTSYERGCFSVCVVWNDVVASGTWFIDAPVAIDHDAVRASLRDGKGTSITFSGVKRQFLSPDQLKDTLDKLAFVFSPALRAGRQIEIDIGDKRRILSAPPEPSWSESIAFDVEIDGRKASARAGVLAANDKSGRRGMSFCYGHRVIITDTNDGCGNYSTAGFAGFVDLDANWNLGQNKSQVIDEAWPKLCAEIEQRVKPLLEKIKNSAHQLQSEAIRGDTADLLNEIIGTGKAKRPAKHGEERTKDKTIKRKVHRSTVVDGIGDVIGPRRRGGSITIDWEDIEDSPFAARVDPNHKCVYLNRCKPVVGQAAKDGDKTVLAIIAACHLFQSLGLDQLDSRNYFGVQMGAILSGSFSIKAQKEPKT